MAQELFLTPFTEIGLSHDDALGIFVDMKSNNIEIDDLPFVTEGDLRQLKWKKFFHLPKILRVRSRMLTSSPQTNNQQEYDGDLSRDQMEFEGRNKVDENFEISRIEKFAKQTQQFQGAPMPPNDHLVQRLPPLPLPLKNNGLLAYPPSNSPVTRSQFSVRNSNREPQHKLDYFLDQPHHDPSIHSQAPISSSALQLSGYFERDAMKSKNKFDPEGASLAASSASLNGFEEDDSVSSSMFNMDSSIHKGSHRNRSKNAEFQHAHSSQHDHHSHSHYHRNNISHPPLSSSDSASLMAQHHGEQRDFQNRDYQIFGSSSSQHSHRPLPANDYHHPSLSRSLEFSNSGASANVHKYESDVNLSRHPSHPNQLPNSNHPYHAAFNPSTPRNLKPYYKEGKFTPFVRHIQISFDEDEWAFYDPSLWPIDCPKTLLYNLVGKMRSAPIEVQIEREGNVEKVSAHHRSLTLSKATFCNLIYSHWDSRKRICLQAGQMLLERPQKPKKVSSSMKPFIESSPSAVAANNQQSEPSTHLQNANQSSQSNFEQSNTQEKTLNQLQESSMPTQSNLSTQIITYEGSAISISDAQQWLAVLALADLFFMPAKLPSNFEQRHFAVEIQMLYSLPISTLHNNILPKLKASQRQPSLDLQFRARVKLLMQIDELHFAKKFRQQIYSFVDLENHLISNESLHGKPKSSNRYDIQAAEAENDSIQGHRFNTNISPHHGKVSSDGTLRNNQHDMNKNINFVSTNSVEEMSQIDSSKIMLSSSQILDSVGNVSESASSFYSYSPTSSSFLLNGRPEETEMSQYRLEVSLIDELKSSSPIQDTDSNRSNKETSRSIESPAPRRRRLVATEFLNKLSRFISEESSSTGQVPSILRNGKSMENGISAENKTTTEREGERVMRIESANPHSSSVDSLATTSDDSLTSPILPKSHQQNIQSKKLKHGEMNKISGVSPTPNNTPKSKSFHQGSSRVATSPSSQSIQLSHSGGSSLTLASLPVAKSQLLEYFRSQSFTPFSALPFLEPSISQILISLSQDLPKGNQHSIDVLELLVQVLADSNHESNSIHDCNPYLTQLRSSNTIYSSYNGISPGKSFTTKKESPSPMHSTAHASIAADSAVRSPNSQNFSSVSNSSPASHTTTTTTTTTTTSPNTVSAASPVTLSFASALLLHPPFPFLWTQSLSVLVTEKCEDIFRLSKVLELVEWLVQLLSTLPPFAYGFPEALISSSSSQSNVNLRDCKTANPTKASVGQFHSIANPDPMSQAPTTPDGPSPALFTSFLQLFVTYIASPRFLTSLMAAIESVEALGLKASIASSPVSSVSSSSSSSSQSPNPPRSNTSLFQQKGQAVTLVLQICRLIHACIVMHPQPHLIFPARSYWNDALQVINSSIIPESERQDQTQQGGVKEEIRNQSNFHSSFLHNVTQVSLSPSMKNDTHSTIVTSSSSITHPLKPEPSASKTVKAGKMQPPPPPRPSSRASRVVNSASQNNNNMPASSQTNSTNVQTAPHSVVLTELKMLLNEICNFMDSMQTIQQQTALQKSHHQ